VVDVPGGEVERAGHCSAVYAAVVTVQGPPRSLLRGNRVKRPHKCAAACLSPHEQVQAARAVDVRATEAFA